MRFVHGALLVSGRLDRALASEVGEGVALRWRPFMLYPNAPKEGWDRFEFLQRRYGDNADIGRIPERLRQEAEDAGIELRYDLIQRTPNTLMAHRLMDWFYAASRVSRSDGSLDVEGTSEVGRYCCGACPTQSRRGFVSGLFLSRHECWRCRCTYRFSYRSWRQLS